MNTKEKTRLFIKIALSVLVIIAIVSGWLFVFPTLHKESDYTVQIENIRLSGTSPQEKIARLAALIHTRYSGKAAIAGIYKVDPATNVDIVRYDILIQLPQPKTVAEYKEVIQKKDKILGELALGTAKLLVAKTDIPKIGTKSIYNMLFFVSTIYVAEVSDEKRQGDFLESTPFLQQQSEMMLYIFDSQDMVELLDETDILQWSKYATPSPFFPSVPNTGPTEETNEKILPNE